MILLGKSGESDEMVGILPILKKLNCKIIAITANRESTLAQHSDVIIFTPVEQEACALNLAPTCSTTAALVVGDALAITLMKLKKFSRSDYALFHPGGRLGKRLLYKVDDLMKSGNENPIVYEDDIFNDVVSAIIKGRVNGVSVIDHKDNFKGLITGFDLRKTLVSTDNFKETTAKEIMFENPITIESGTFAIEAYEIMRNNPKPIFQLPVLIGTKVIGIITLQDMVRAGL